MKMFFGVVGLALGIGMYGLIDLRQDYALSVELAEANCAILVLSDPNIKLVPAEIDCQLISDDDFLLTFEVNSSAKLYVDCLSNFTLFGREISSKQCRSYRR